MQLGSIIQLTAAGATPKPSKVTKVGAGYVHHAGSDYRCRECWKFIPATNQCAEFRSQDTAKPHGTCTYWAFGKPVAGLKPSGAFTPAELGYTEDPNGTKCIRCKYFDSKGYCQKVDESSPGDDPGKITPGACCANQTPKVRG